MHRQGRSPKGSVLFVFMGRAAEGRGRWACGRSCVSGLRQVGRGFRFFPVILFMVRSLSVRLAGLLAPAYLCTDWQPETVVMAGRAGLRAIGNRIPEGEVAAWDTDRGNCKK